jgi:ribonuclease Y
MFLVIYLVVGICVGIVVGYFLRQTVAVKKAGTAEAKAETLLKEARDQAKEILLAAKDKSLKIIEEAKEEETNRRQEILRLRSRLEKREALFDQKLLEIENKKEKLDQETVHLSQMKEEIKEIRLEQLKKLEKISQLSREEAKRVLLENTEREVKEDLVTLIRKLELESAEELEKKAKEILTPVIERCSVSHAAEITSTVVSLPSDEMKGRIIGREGRNIRSLEQLTGVEIVIDDTPEVITISGFSPIRRQVAKRALEKLIQDGRIHPARIEGVVEESKKELALDIKKAGEEALYKLGLTGFDPRLVQLIGRLKYRTSYGQNILNHSIEVANLSNLLAEELGADPVVAKKAGLLHDIGKAVDHEIQGTHPEIGKTIALKFDLPDAIVVPIATHHEDRPPTLEAIIIKVADAISGARVGARKDTYEQYLQRLEELERLASAFPGVEKVYAIQAGREIRVFVTPEAIDDLAAYKLAKEIAQRIEEDLKYPGEIKVSVIRETRVVEYAR